ncbi:peptidoglycan DD-metalloendopeptidase family protein [Nocardioides sp. SOB77]|uniref:Peptidoglycan DD-metalloendopeptidase family protein n=1 Tax=Nocardioides oceani TaxID=3058369 RepID=A0ABT8FDM7_9ACTN|nr:peptidoglycan DD-metalloendopeptidase family protein [Nocardioides oceani]MDN4172788.1 peptidoglycan DD-metalloendopeptidase family protein [Nocardioides oceani]
MRPHRPLLALAPLLLVLGLLTAAPTAPAVAKPDPDWVFYTADTTRYTSPWFAGKHRIMIPFGCTRAPYYSPDPRCEDERGFHHGIDVAMGCGTKLRTRFWARVVSNDALGPAYGSSPVVLRNRKRGWDVVIGHTRKVLVREGDTLTPGTFFARASDDAAPDGCHLHFEKRTVGGGLSTATWPRPLLRLQAAS